MTEEELKQKGIKYACEYPSSQDRGYLRPGYKRVDLRKAYIAGAKENGIEWHDLRKDSNDLPKRNNELTDRSDVVITDKGIAHYNFRKQKWYVHNFECDMSISEDVIAWCEIPTFDKE